MKILQVANSFKYAWGSGGVARVAYDISSALARRGHEVTVFTTDKGLDERYNFKRNQSVNLDGMNVFYFKNLSDGLAKKGISIPYYSLFVATRKLIEFDVIHIHELRRIMNVFLYHYARKYNVPYVLQAHGSLPPSRSLLKRSLSWIFDILFGYRLLRDASKVIALSRMEAEQYRGMGVPEEKIEVIPNGIDLSDFADLPPKGCFKKKFNILESKKIILYLGRIHKIKGIDILVKAFAKVIEKLDYVRLVIVGPDDGYLGELEALIKAFKIEDKVLITGSLYGRDKLGAYVDADVYVLPSKYEIWGMTVLEAVACETPVILTENCGIAEYFRDKVGLVVKPEPNHLCEALLEMLLDQDRQNKFRKKCRTVIERFDISKTVSKLEQVYEGIVK